MYGDLIALFMQPLRRWGLEMLSKPILQDILFLLLHGMLLVHVQALHFSSVHVHVHIHCHCTCTMCILTYTDRSVYGWVKGIYPYPLTPVSLHFLTGGHYNRVLYQWPGSNLSDWTDLHAYLAHS